MSSTPSPSPAEVGSRMQSSLEIAIRLGAIALLIGGCLVIVAPFAGIVIWGLIIAIAAETPFEALCRALRGRRYWAAAIAILVSGLSTYRLRGLALALTIWLVTTVLYDGFVLWFTIAFRDVPLQQPLLALTLANPVDLARVMLLHQLDAASLMGATAAVFQRTFGGTIGITIPLTALSLWALIPGILALRAFRRRDF